MSDRVVLVEHPTKLPTRKVTAGGLAAALVTILVWLGDLAGVDIPPVVASALSSVLYFLAAYLVRNAEHLDDGD